MRTVESKANQSDASLTSFGSLASLFLAPLGKFDAKTDKLHQGYTLVYEDKQVGYYISTHNFIGILCYDVHMNILICICHFCTESQNGAITTQKRVAF